MPKTAQFIEETKSAKSADTTHPVKQKKQRGDPARIAAWQWKPGQSGNPGGKPKHDMAAEVAKAVFSQNPDAIYKAMSKALLAGNAYVFKELAERAYGKLKESKEVTHRHEEVADKDLNERIRELEHELGLAGAIDEAGRSGIAQARAAETVSEPQDK